MPTKQQRNKIVDKNYKPTQNYQKTQWQQKQQQNTPINARETND